MENKKRTVYIVESDWANRNGENESSVSDVFTDKADAVAYFNQAVADERAVFEECGYDQDKTSEDGNTVELYEEGNYCANHMCVSLKEMTLSMSGQFEHEVFQRYERDCRMEDLMGELEQLDEDGAGVLADRGTKKLKEILTRNRAVDRLDKALGNNDAYWESYWNTVQYVLEAVRDAEEKRQKEEGGVK